MTSSLNATSVERIAARLGRRMSRWSLAALAAAAVLSLSGLVSAQSTDNSTSERKGNNNSKHTVRRQYTQDERIRYQLWDYTWNPQPDQPITRIEVRIGEQKVYVYQDDYVAGTSPTTTGKDGHNTPPGHYTIIKKDIDHQSNLYGVMVDSHGYIVDADAKNGDKPPAGAVYDAADMPYYMQIRDDGTGLHAGYLPGYRASHGCIRLPNAFAELLYSNVSLGTPVDVVP